MTRSPDNAGSRSGFATRSDALSKPREEPLSPKAQDLNLPGLRERLRVIADSSPDITPEDRAVIREASAALLSAAEAREEAGELFTEQFRASLDMAEKADRAEFLLALALACCEQWSAEDCGIVPEWQASELRAQQAEARVGELSKALNTVWTLKHVYEAQLDEHDGELDGEDLALVSGIYADIRLALSSLPEEGFSGSSRPGPKPVAQTTAMPPLLDQGEGDATTPEGAA